MTNSGESETVRRLRERCEELEEELKQLKQAFSDSISDIAGLIKQIVGAQPMQNHILAWMYVNFPRILIKNSTSMEMIRSLTTHLSADYVDTKVMDVHMHKLRGNLVSAGAEKSYIKTHWGQGYSLTKAGYEWLHEKLKEKGNINGGRSSPDQS